MKVEMEGHFEAAYSTDDSVVKWLKYAVTSQQRLL